MALNSLSDLQFYCNGIWYQRWILPALSEWTSTPNQHIVNKLSNGLQIFGEAAFIFKLIVNLKSLKSNLSLNRSLTENGWVVEKRRLVKAGFNLTDIALTIAAGIGYFILAASWSSPLFLAISSVNLIKTVYCLSKNIYNAQFYQNNNAYSKTNPELHAAILKRHHAKIIKSSFDLAIGVVLLGCTVLWVTCPVPAAISLLTVAIIYYFGRKQLKEYSQACKQQVLKLFPENQPLTGSPTDIELKELSSEKDKLSHTHENLVSETQAALVN